MRCSFIVVLSIAISFHALAQRPFITTWKTDNPGASEDSQISIPTSIDFAYDYAVDWGDGSSDSNVTGNITHSYSNPGTYNVSISGDFPSILFSGNGDKDKILSVNQWGDNNWLQLKNAFEGCTNLEVNATDAPDLSSVNSLTNMFKDAVSFNQSIDHWETGTINEMIAVFRGASSFNQPLNNWDVGNVTNMGSLFSGANTFNQPLDQWDVSNVLDMSGMFERTAFNQNINNWNVGSVAKMIIMFGGCRSFNQPLDQWDVSNVQFFDFMFQGCSSFNQPLNDWDVSSAISIAYMFRDAEMFDQPLVQWDVSNVTNMEVTFGSAREFNQPLNSWDVSNVTDMSSLFRDARSFNQPLDNWDVSSVEDMSELFSFAQSFDQPLGMWDVSSVLDMGQMFEGVSSNFNHPLEDWDVSNVKDMNSMFSLLFSFNQPLGSWNVSNVENMRSMFTAARSFNKPLDDWDVSNVKNMEFMFVNAQSFDQPLDNWDVSNVTSMTGMFRGAQNFDQPISVWNVSNVTSTSQMFFEALNFNQPLSEWNVLNVSVMDQMFYNASSFDQSLGAWNVSNVSDMDRMFDKSNVSIHNYDDILSGWSSLMLQSDVPFGTVGLSYCLGFEAREKLVDDFGWDISGDTNNCIDNSMISLSLSRDGSSAFSIDEISYFGLGRNGSNYFNDFYAWDLDEQLLSPIAIFGGLPRKEAISFVINNKAYVGLGQDVEGNYLKDFYSYDPLTDTWTKLADFGGGERSDAIAISINGFGYVGTGINDVDEQKDFWRYDPASDTWTQMTDVPSDKRRGAFAFEIDGKGYVGGGFNFDGFSFQLSDIQEYDPETNTWTEKIFADGINLSVNNAATFSLHGNGYIAYGSKENLVKYNPITNEVKNLGDVFGLGGNRNDPVAFVSGDSAVFGLGSFSFFPTAYSNTFDFYFEENILPTNLSLDNLRMEENSAEMSLVGMLTVEDADEFKGHSFAFTAGGGTNNSDNTSFSITNNELFTNESFDFESKNMYQLNIEAIDSRGGKATMAFEVLVVDVNEEPTDIVLEERNLVEVDNDEQVFLVAGSLGTIDQDSGDSFVYSIVQGDGQNDTDNDRFRIDASQLSILAPNFEEKSNYSVNIQSQDQEGLTFVKSFNISVSDRNDTPTELLLSGREVVENAMPGTLIGSFTTVDEDEPDPSTFTYILQNDLPGQFEVQGSDLLVGAGLRGVSEDSEVFLVVLSQDPQGVQFFADFSIKVLNEPEPLGVSKNVDILIYPNPVENTLKLSHDHLTNSDYQLQVLNVQGKVLLESSNSNELDVSELNSGTYILKLIIDGAVSSRKFLKN